MIARVLAWSGRHPLKVLLVAVGIAVVSYLGQRSLARDVLPDLSDPQVVLFAEWMGHPALEVSTRVTQVLTEALQGIPGSTAIRGQSMSGMAYLDVIFGSVADIPRGRSEILARVDKLRLRLPTGLRLQVGPEASSTGWVFQYALVPPQPKKGGMPMGARRPDEGPSSLFGLRKFQDEVLRPEIAAIPGVAEVASVGGDPKEVLVETSPEQLRGAGFAFSDVMQAAHAVLKDPHATLEQLQNAPLGAPAGRRQAEEAPARLSQVALVRVAPGMSSGMTDIDGLQPIVAGIVIAKRDADIASLLVKVRAVIDKHRKQLPKDVSLGVIYDRSELGAQVERTLFRAVGEEIVVVSLVLLLFLLHVRSALMPMVTLPLVVLLTFVSMRLIGLPSTIMSLGGIAIALGMAVDADVVALEACHRRIESGDVSGAGKRAAIIAAASSFAPAILTSLVIAALAFIPVFAFGGESGRLLRPLAITKTLVIGAAALMTLTVAPALRDRLLGRKVVAELRNPLTRTLVRAYRPFVHFALSRPVFTLVTAGLAAVSSLPIVVSLGGEFLPRLDEGSLLYMPTTAPGVSSDDAVADLARQDLALADRPEVALVFGKAGRADTATDPAPYSMIETTIRLKPRSQWPKLARQRWYSSWAPAQLRRMLGKIWPEQTPATTAELVESLDRSTRFAGWTNAWTAPIRARLDMMSTGVRTPAGIRIVTDDHARLDALGAAVRSAVLGVPGTKSAFYESLGGETRLEFVPDAAAMARQKVDPALAHATAELLIGGGWLGEMTAPDETTPEPEGTAVAARRTGADGVIMPAVLVLGAESEKGKPPVGTESQPAHTGFASSLRVRLTIAERWHPRPLDQWLRETTVRGAARGGEPVPLALLGRPEFVTVPSQLRAEKGGPVGYVYVNLTGDTDVAKYVDRARDQVENAVKAGPIGLRPGERLEWTGQYELMVAGQKRLMLIAPVVALLMLGLLLIQFRSLTEALMVLASVPFALVGSFWTLYLLDYKMSAPVWVGLLSVVGLAMQTGVVMVVYIDDAFHRRLRNGEIRNRADIVAAHAEGTVLRLRPKIMTITAMGAGLLPLLWARGAGSEIMRRVAAPMLGGLLTSAFLTLEVIPVLYTVWRYHQLKRAQRLGVPLEEIVRPAPAWARHDEQPGT